VLVVILLTRRQRRNRSTTKIYLEIGNVTTKHCFALHVLQHDLPFYAFNVIELNSEIILHDRCLPSLTVTLNNLHVTQTQLELTIPISNTVKMSPWTRGQLRGLINQPYYIALVVKRDEKMLALVELRHMTPASNAGFDVCVITDNHESPAVSIETVAKLG
jgi:hypothetical protein